jgi:hypothetical protein
MLEKENAFYEAHKEEFREKYLNKWLIIVGDSLFGVCDTVVIAAKTALMQFEPGEFMLHTPADDGRVIEIGPVIHTKYPDRSQDSRPKAVMSISEGDLLAFPYA